MRRVAGVDSRENEATRGRPGEENGRVEVKDSRHILINCIVDVQLNVLI